MPSSTSALRPQTHYINQRPGQSYKFIMRTSKQSEEKVQQSALMKTIEKSGLHMKKGVLERESFEI